jgi:Phage integrase family
VREGIANILTEKTKIKVSIPILPALQGILDAGPTSDLAFICGDRWQPLTKNTFSTYFRTAADAAGIAKSAHGVRKAGAIRLAHNGVTVAELDAVFGWQGGGMAALYIKEADRARLAKGAMAKLGETSVEQTIPSPPVRVRERSQKNE